MSLEYRVGDVFDRLAEIGDGTVDLIVTSPPFLALRSYLPADHPDKGKEIGSEATPAQFIDTLLALTCEFGRVLAPHGSLCVELGDTYAGGGAVDKRADTNGKIVRKDYVDRPSFNHGSGAGMPTNGTGWPLAKSLTGIPTLYPWSLAYGRNLLTGAESPAGLWRIRNIIVWARPNPPVGALGDKFRPATSYITVACRGVRRFFDLDAVRTELQRPESEGRSRTNGEKFRAMPGNGISGGTEQGQARYETNQSHPAGAPPLDWHSDLQDGDWLWKLPTQPYKGAHYATFPLELPTRLIRAMCPLRVCTICGKPSERIIREENCAPERLALAAHIRQQREAKRLTVKDVAHHFPSRTGGMTGCVSNWEHATNVPTIEQWLTLKTILELSDEFDEVITGERRWSDSTVEYEVNGSLLASDERDITGYRRGGFGSRPGRVDATRLAPDGWSDCGHNTWRTGVTLDPFAGSGTTLQAAQNVGRHAIGIDLDPRNAELARSRVGMFLEVVGDEPTAPITMHNSTGNPRFRVGYVRTSGGAPDRRNYGEPTA